MQTLRYKSLALAAEYHKYQQYGSKPYIYHLLDVWFEAERFCKQNNITGNKYDEILSVCALHDILEDTDMDENKIKEISIIVYNNVKLLTKKNTIDNYYKEISKSKIASIVKICDRICNVRESIRNKNYHKFKKYINESEQFKIIYFKFNKPLSNRLKLFYLKGILINIFRIPI